MTHMLGVTLVRVTITDINWHMSHVECMMIYSAVIVNIKDTDSAKRLLRLSNQNRWSQSMVSRNLFTSVYITLC